MSKVHTSVESRKSLVEGAKKIGRMCRSILGPSATQVAFGSTGNTPPFLTSDGATAVREIVLPDGLENIGVRLLRDAAQKTNDEAGDGTTTTITMAVAMMEQALRLKEAGFDVKLVCTELDKWGDFVEKEIREQAIPLETEKQIQAVATAAANDEELGKIIAEGIAKVGQDGLFTVDESFSDKTEVVVEEGAVAEGGWMSSAYAQGQRHITLNDAVILYTDEVIEPSEPLAQLLNQLLNKGKSVVLMCGGIHEKMEKPILKSMFQRGAMRVVTVKAPYIGEERLARLHDLATITGGVVFSRKTGLSYKKATADLLGRAKRVLVESKKTVLIDGAGTQERILERAAQIKREIEKAPSSYEKEKAQERLSCLLGGIAVLKLSGNKYEVRRKKFRVEDAVRATQSSMEEGIVPGGGTVFARASQLGVLISNEHQAAAWKIMQEGLQAPFKNLVMNRGYNFERMMIKLEPFDVGKFNISTSEGLAPSPKDYRRFVVDVRSGDLVECMESGIVESAKVLRCALRNALSIIRIFLNSQVIVMQ